MTKTSNKSKDQKPMMTFEALVADQHLTGLVNRYRAGAMEATDSGFTSIIKPDYVLTSKHYPGFRVMDLAGPGAEETLGVLLGQSIKTKAHLEEFRRALTAPDLVGSIVRKLFPRRDVALKRGRYVLSEPMVTAVIDEHMTAYAPSVRAAIGYVLNRTFSAMGVLKQGPVERIVRSSEAFAIRIPDLSQYIIIDACKDMFSEARIAEISKQLSDESTPDIIADVISRVLRHAAFSIPEVALRLTQLDSVVSLVRNYLVSPHKLNDVLRAHPSLITLASYANFIFFAYGTQVPELPIGENADLKEACNSILSLIQTNPALDVTPLATFASHFGVVPASSPDALYRGAVVYQALTQQSKMEVLAIEPSGSSIRVTSLAPSYAPISSLASELNRSALSLHAFEGACNLIADELALEPFEVGDFPSLITVGLSEDDLFYLGLAMAEVVAFGYEEGVAKRPRLLMGASIQEQWRMFLGAATPSVGYFSDVATLVLYALGAERQEQTALPSRSQTITAKGAMDTIYRLSPDDEMLSDKIQQTFQFEIPIRDPRSESGAVPLKLQITPLHVLMGWEPEDRLSALPDTSFYATFAEPGVDRDLNMLLRIVIAYARSTNKVMADRAQSWLIETFASAISHPEVRVLTTRAVNKAIRERSLDSRRLASQMRELIARSHFAAFFAILARYDKISGDIVSDIVDVTPVSGLTTSATLTLATLPYQLTGNNA